MNCCKYYNKHLETVREYISCLYRLDGCCTGGLLHIVLDDGNLDADDIQWCLEQCVIHPEREESEIGKLICISLLGLPIEQRRLVYQHDWKTESECWGPEHCSQCWIEKGDEE